jgi:hypothetical protein
MDQGRRRASIRGYVFGVISTVLLLTLSGSATVSADGGQQDLIHACVLPIVDGGNLKVVGANDACPDGSTPLHWAGPSLEPPGETAPPPEPDAPSGGSGAPSNKVSKRLYGTFGIKIKKTKSVTKTLGPSVSTWKELTVSCPGSAPFAVSGEADADLHEQGGVEVDHWSEVSSPVGWHAWNVKLRAYKTIYGFTAPNGAKLFPAQVETNWTLILTVECAKLAKGPTNVGL